MGSPGSVVVAESLDVTARPHSRLGTAVSLLAIVAGGLAAWRLGLEVLWFGSLVAVEAAVTHPAGAAAAVAALGVLALVGAADRPHQVALPGSWIRGPLSWLVSLTTGVFLFQIVAGALVITLLSGRGVYDWSRVGKPWLEHPVLGVVNLVLLGA